MQATTGRVALTACRRCGGDMHDDGDYLGCLQCGYEEYEGNHLARSAPDSTQRSPGYMRIRYDGVEPGLEGRILLYRKIHMPHPNNATQNNIDALCPYEGCGRSLKVLRAKTLEARRDMKCRNQHIVYVSVDREPIGWR